MDNNITIYKNNQFGEIRTIGEFFIAQDICKALSLDDVSKACSRLDDDEKLIRTLFVSGQNRQVLLINESGLYHLIMTSRLDKAKEFRRWVTSEVLPGIRKHGMYATPDAAEQMLNDPDMMIRILEGYKAERAKRASVEMKLEEQKPKVLFADAVAGSQTSILIGDLAKLIAQKGVDIGQNRLFEWMRDNGYLMSRGTSRNVPTQRSIELKVMEIKERTITTPDGRSFISDTPYITGKGQVYFVNKFLTGGAYEQT